MCGATLGVHEVFEVRLEGLSEVELMVKYSLSDRMVIPSPIRQYVKLPSASSLMPLEVHTGLINSCVCVCVCLCIYLHLIDPLITQVNRIENKHLFYKSDLFLKGSNQKLVLYLKCYINVTWCTRD